MMSQILHIMVLPSAAARVALGVAVQRGAWPVAVTALADVCCHGVLDVLDDGVSRVVRCCGVAAVAGHGGGVPPAGTIAVAGFSAVAHDASRGPHDGWAGPGAAWRV